MTHSEEKENLLEKAMDDFCKSLNEYGCEEVLKLLLFFSDTDKIVNRLLAKFPGIVCVGDFLYRLPSYEVDEKTFKKILETQGPIWIKRGEKKEREDHVDAQPTISKRKRRSKRKKLPKSDSWLNQYLKADSVCIVKS